MTSCPLCLSRAVVEHARVDGQTYHRCAQCQLVFLSPSQLPARSEEKAQYDLHENDPSDPGYRRFLSQVTTPLLGKLQPGACGLDYGCGPGPALVTMIKEAGFACTGYDPIYADEPSALARQYDFITCTEVVEHFHHPHREFARLTSLLQPGGWLAIMTRWLTEDVDFSRWHYRRDPTHVCFYCPATFDWLAQHYGLRVTTPQDHVVLLQKQD